MDIHFRTRAAHPDKLAEAATFAADMARLATEITGVEVLAWTTLHGRPMGSTAWTWRAESLAQSADLGEKVIADPDFLARLDQGGSLFVGPTEEVVGQVVAVVGEASPSRYAATITAQCQPGRMADAMQWAVEAQEAACALTGRDGLLLRGLYGPFATVTWITPADSLEQVDEGSAVLADPAFIERMDQAGSLFIPGHTESLLHQRIG